MPRETLKINLFSPGRSDHISTWSSVPYFLSTAMLKHGAAVRRINLLPEQAATYRAYRAAYWKYDGLTKRFMAKRRPLDPFRDRVVRSLINKRIRSECAEHADADFNFFLTYSFSSLPGVSTPTVHLSDICLQHALEDTQAAIRPRHRHLIEEEKRHLSRAALVLGTNEPCCRYLREHYGTTGARKLQGGINLDWSAPDDLQSYFDRKWRERRVLFIGRGVHKRGVDILLQAFERFNRERAEPYRLTLIGVSEQEIAPVPEAVECITFLDKNNPTDLARYIDLLASATLFLMPMREGPPPGVLKEALLTGTPVIVSNIWHADSQVRHDVCGRLVDTIEPDAFANEMSRLARDRQSWQTMAQNAMAHARQWSWYNSVGQLLEDLSGLRKGDAL